MYDEAWNTSSFLTCCYIRHAAPEYSSGQRDCHDHPAPEMSSMQNLPPCAVEQCITKAEG